MNKLDTSLQSKLSNASANTETQPTMFKLFTALGNARQLCDGSGSGKKADKLAAEIRVICVGKQFERVRQLVAAFEAAKDEAAREQLAEQLYAELGLLVTIAPVTAMEA